MTNFMVKFKENDYGWSFNLSNKDNVGGYYLLI
jgi:hypothetical protein